MTPNAELLLAVQLQQAGIPFEREVRFAHPRRWRADFQLLEHPKLLVEVEGGAWVQGRHVRGSGFEADLEKYNAAAERGFVVLRFSPRQINEGTALEQIRRILSKKEEPDAA